MDQITYTRKTLDSNMRIGPTRTIIRRDFTDLCFASPCHIVWTVVVYVMHFLWSLCNACLKRCCIMWPYLLSYPPAHQLEREREMGKQYKTVRGVTLSLDNLWSHKALRKDKCWKITLLYAFWGEKGSLSGFTKPKRERKREREKEEQPYSNR